MVKGYTLIEVFVAVVFISILFLIILGGCYAFRASHVTEGIVTYREFIPEHTETDTTYVDVGNDIDIPITHSYVVPDKYIIKISGKYKDGVYTRTLFIDKTSYQMIRVGDYLRVADLPLVPKAEKE